MSEGKNNIDYLCVNKMKKFRVNKKHVLDHHDELVFRSNKKNNTINFMDNVNKISIQKFIRYVEKILSDKPSDTDTTITYIVNSPGGSVSSVLLFVDFIKITKEKYPNVKFVSIATGCIASAATIMCIVADTKYITKYAKAMIHELSNGVRNSTFTHISSSVNHSIMSTKKLNNIYLNNIRKNKKGKPMISRRKLDKLLTNETWFDSYDYVKSGFADEVL